MDRENSIKIEIKPLSINEAYTNPVGKRGRVSTQKLRSFHDKFGTLFLAKAGARNLPIKDPLELSMLYLFDGPRIRKNENCEGMPVNDVTNYDKPILDALEGLLYENDNQIQGIRLKKEAADRNLVKIGWSVV